MSQDLRLALRLLWRDRTFSLTAGLTLALCIGANTALFAVVQHVLLRPLPFLEPQQILLMANAYPGAGLDDVGENSGVPDYYDRLRELTVYDEQAIYRGGDVTVDEGGTPTRIRVTAVTPSFFRLLRVPAAIGRTFVDAEGEPGAERQVVLSHGFWQSHFGGDRHVVGSRLRLDGQPYTVVGVMPRDFVFLSDDVRAWRPAAFSADDKSDAHRHSNGWRNIGRLKPGATAQQAQSQVDALNARNLDRFPQYKKVLIDARFHTIVTPLQDHIVRDVKPTLLLLWAGALFVLLIGGVNVANLALVRSRARLKELATRLALGAGRPRIARQLITESLLLTLVAAIVGLSVGELVLRALGTLNLHDLPRGFEIRIDEWTVAYTLAMAALIGLAVGMIPVANVLPIDLTSALREEGRGGTAGRSARRLRRALVVMQLAFAFVLLVGAGLLFASFHRLLAVDPGFNPTGVLTATVRLPEERYKDDTSRIEFLEKSVQKLRAVPGVASAGATDTIPFGGNHSDSVILAEGYQMHPGESLISPNRVMASAGYFEAMGATLVRGRFFDDRDRLTGQQVVIVDEKLAHRFWPGQDPIGRRLFQPRDINNLLAITDKTVFRTVVGVVHDIKLADLVTGNGAVGAYYFPLSQASSGYLTFAIKTSGDPASLSGAFRQAMASLDHDLPVYDTQTMEQRTDKSLMARRSPMLLSMGFAGVALLLAAMGIYGVLAYLVTQRRKEIGIRIALGSSANGIVDLILREGLVLIALGLGMGGVAAMALRKSIEGQLFGVRASDPTVLIAVTALLAVVAVGACVIPARRASRIDPIIALAE